MSFQGCTLCARQIGTTVATNGPGRLHMVDLPTHRETTGSKAFPSEGERSELMTFLSTPVSSARG